MSGVPMAASGPFAGSTIWLSVTGDKLGDTRCGPPFAGGAQWGATLGMMKDHRLKVGLSCGGATATQKSPWPLVTIPVAVR